MKEARPSRTAEWVAFLRGLGTLEERPIAPDPLAVRLVGEPFRQALELLGRSPRAVQRLIGLADRFSGGRGHLLPLRTRAIDDEVAAAVDAGAKQLVILGAGLDARAYRLDSLAGVAVYEVDHPATQGWKRARVSGMSPRAASVRHVSVNFERERWPDRLAAAGLDFEAKAAFIWEGVTMYLSSDAIHQTLQGIRRSGPGTRLLMTYRTPDRSERNRAVGLLVGLAGEPFITTFSPDEARALVEAHGFHVLHDAGDEEWSAQYLKKRLAGSVARLLVCER
jgi:methyltransferase (TIGR00027 family)